MEYKNVAIVHDWLTGISGTEQVLKEISAQFPEAPIFVLYYDSAFTNDFLPGRHIIPVVRSRKALIRRLLRMFGFFLFPFMIEYIDLRDYDLVISTGTIFSKGVITRSHALHIHYCHSPTRQIWDWSHEYAAEEGKKPRFIKRIYQHLLRIWDFEAAQRPDIIIANSATTQQRIQKYYTRSADIIFPPVRAKKAHTEAQHEARKLIKNLKPDGGYFIIISRLYPHKNIELAVRAFEKLGWHLIVVGDGPLYQKINHNAEPNIHMLGYQDDSTCAELLNNALGFIMPQEEDFGITSVEALMAGKPVLALRRAGATEFITEGENGMFFEDPTEEVLAWGVKRFRDAIQVNSFDPTKIRRTAERFESAVFRGEIMEVLRNIQQ